jgi:hypothetical protein
MMRWLGGMVAAWLLPLSSVAFQSERVPQRRFELLRFIG